MKKIIIILLTIFPIYSFSQINNKLSDSEKSILISKASLKKFAFTECFYAKNENKIQIKDIEFAHYNIFGFEPITIEEQRKSILEIRNFSIIWGSERKQNLGITPIINCLELYESKELDVLIDSAILHINKEELKEFILDPDFKYIGTYKYYYE